MLDTKNTSNAAAAVGGAAAATALKLPPAKEPSSLQDASKFAAQTSGNTSFGSASYNFAKLPPIK